MRIALRLSLFICFCVLAIVTASAQIRMGLPGPEKIELRSPEVSVPMKLFGNRPVVDVILNGKGPYKFILDTGAAGTILDQALAGELKLPTLGEVRVGSPIGGQSQAGKLVRLDQLEMGQAKVTGLQCVAMDLQQLLKAQDAPRGILSAALFAGYLLTLDYPQNRIIVRAGDLPAADTGEVFEYDPGQRLPSIKISVAGTVIEAHIDSGSPRGIVLPIKYAEQIPLATKPVEVGKGRTVDAEFVILSAKLNGAVKLGRYTLSNPDIFFNDAAPVGNIGYDILRDFALTFDRKNRRIQLQQRAGTAPASTHSEKNIRRELEANYKRIVEAFKKKDTSVWAELLVPDFKLKLFNGSVQDRQWVVNYVRNNTKTFKVLDLSMTTKELQTLGDDTVAVVEEKSSRAFIDEQSKSHQLDAGALQRETWTKTASGWGLKSVEEWRVL